jgi:polyphenol oxidase
LKFEFQSKSDYPPIFIPTIFQGYPEVIAGMSLRSTAINEDNYFFNLSYKVGDDHHRVQNNRNQFFSKLRMEEKTLADADQCHSTLCRHVITPGRYESCDALVTDKKQIPLAVSIADCVPILLYEPSKRIIGAVHAGWRGTVNGILTRTVEMMKELFLVDPETIRAFIGPSAGVCCYEVSDEVAVMFEDKIVSSHSKYKIDLKKQNLVQLQRSGLLTKHIELSPDCTICNKERFHSFRRDGNTSGRMLAVISMKK